MEETKFPQIPDAMLQVMSTVNCHQFLDETKFPHVPDCNSCGSVRWCVIYNTDRQTVICPPAERPPDQPHRQPTMASGIANAIRIIVDSTYAQRPQALLPQAAQMRCTTVVKTLV